MASGTILCVSEQPARLEALRAQLAGDESISVDSRESIGIINRSGEHLLSLINDILEMTKIEAGQVSLKVIDFDLDGLLGRLVEMFDLRARSKGLRLVVDRHPDLPPGLRADEPKLRQVLINLLGNAIKFTHRGQVTLQVAPTTPFDLPPAAGDTLPLTFRVSDTGIGIDLWQQWQPQLIWLDMRMPVLSGYDAAQYIRAQEQDQGQNQGQAPTKIIALTANAFEDDRDRALDTGCDDFVRKPFQIDHLLTKLAQHLNVRYTYGAVAAEPPPLAEVGAIAALRRLPAALLIDLHQATLQLDSAALAQLIAQIAPDHGPLAALLTRQLEAYAFDTLHTLLQQAEIEG